MVQNAVRFGAKYTHKMISKTYLIEKEEVTL